VTVAPEVALLTTDNGDTSAKDRRDDRMLTRYIKKVLESCCYGIALTSPALDMVKRALLRGPLAEGTTLRRRLHILRRLIPDTLNILRDILTNETTPVGRAQAPIPGAYPILREVPETAPEATSPSSTKEALALVLPETSSVQPESESSEQRHSATGKDLTEAVSAPKKRKTAELQSELQSPKPLHLAAEKHHTKVASTPKKRKTAELPSELESLEPLHSATEKHHTKVASTLTKHKTAELQSGIKSHKRIHSPMKMPTRFWPSDFPVLSLTRCPPNPVVDMSFGLNKSRQRSSSVVKVASGQDKDPKQLAPLGNFWADRLGEIFDSKGRKLPVHNLRELNPQLSERCHALVSRLYPYYHATGAMVLHDENQIQLVVRAEAQQGSEGALITAISSGNALTWTGSTITYERGDFPLTYDFTEILLGSEADFEPMDIDTSTHSASDASDLSMKDVVDESEEDSSSSEDSDDGSSDDDDNDIDSFDGTNFDGSDSSDDGDSSDDDSGDGALAWKLQATRALQQMDDVISNDNGRGDRYFTAGTGLSTKSVHQGAQLAAPTTPVDQPMEDFS
jgi:hypothetical protein